MINIEEIQQENLALKHAISLFCLEKAEIKAKFEELEHLQNQLTAEKQNIEIEKNKIEEKNKKIWKMSEAALKESHRLEEVYTSLQAEKEKLEAEKKKLDEKVKKLWQTSITIHKEKERISELNDLLEAEKQKTDALLADIQIKNKEITDNINYAQRIQSAILPNMKQVYKSFEQAFILYMPKDIVSGDFYAFAEKAKLAIMIAGDCTGHGVSGAFMSMIGNLLLNQIINEKGITEPASILNHLNSAIIESLKQSENDSNDGMDISICTYDINNYSLQYAGANRPLWMVRDNAIYVTAPDKFPIGGLQAARDRTFTNHNIHLQKNDTIYQFTDGYADQFGGERGKKLMTSKFKELLLSIQHTPMPEQELYLRNFFESWRGQHEQIDDVLVAAVRV